MHPATVLLALGALVALPAGVQSTLSTNIPQQRWPRWTLDASDHHWATFAFDGHIHSNHSLDASHPVADVLMIAERAELDALVITDHGSSAAVRDVENYHGPLTVLLGQEVGGSWGHVVIWNVTDRRGAQGIGETMNQLGAHVHADGGVVVLAHPGWWIEGNAFNPRRWMQSRALRRGGIADTVDALELWNAVYYRPTRALIDEWVDLLEQHLYVPIVGDSDFHTYGPHHLGTPRNVFLCPVDAQGALQQPLDRCLLESVRAGRLFVTDGPMLALYVEGCTFGDVLATTPGTMLHVQARALAPRGGRLQFYLGRQVAAVLDLPAGQERSTTWTVPAPTEDSYVRVEIARSAPGPTPPFSLVSNPIRLDVPPLRSTWRGPLAQSAPAKAGFRGGHPSTLPARGHVDVLAPSVIRNGGMDDHGLPMRRAPSNGAEVALNRSLRETNAKLQ